MKNHSIECCTFQHWVKFGGEKYTWMGSKRPEADRREERKGVDGP